MDSSDVVRAMKLHDRMHFDLSGCGTVYLRRSVRMCDCVRHSLDIADISVIESQRRRYIFSETVAIVEVAAKRLGRCVWVDCIHNDIVTTALERRGYTIVRTVGGLQVDAYKVIE